MRVLMLTWEYPPHVVGGMGKHVCELAPALGAEGIEVHIVTPNLRGGLPEEEVAPNVVVHRVPGPEMSPDAAGLVTFAQASNSSLERKGRELQMELGGFDLIHAHDWLVAYSAVALKYATRLPLVVTVHSMERGRSQGRLESEQALAINGTEWWLTFEAWRVITVSRFMGDQVHYYFEAPRDKIEIINNGVTPPVARLSPEEALEFRRRFASDSEALIFNVGRLVYEKGVQVLVDAAPQILAQYGAAKFVVAGTGSQFNMLRQRTIQRGVQDAFIFTGYLPDEERDRLFEVADVAVFPSLYEPFGIVALEAMVHRCPVVVAAAGGLAEVVKLHETGMTSHPGSAESLAWAVVETLRHRDWAIARADNAFDEVRELYSWPRIARETTEVYRRVQQEWRQSGWT